MFFSYKWHTIQVIGHLKAPNGCLLIIFKIDFSNSGVCTVIKTNTIGASRFSSPCSYYYRLAFPTLLLVVSFLQNVFQRKIINLQYTWFAILRLNYFLWNIYVYLYVINKTCTRSQTNKKVLILEDNGKWNILQFSHILFLSLSLSNGKLERFFSMT